VVGVGLNRIRAMVEGDKPRPGIPCPCRQARVVAHLPGTGRDAVEEDAVDLVPVEVTAQVSDGLGRWTLPVVGVDVPAHRDTGGAHPLQRGQARPVQLVARPVRQVEDDQPDPRRVQRQPLPFPRMRGGVEVRGHDHLPHAKRRVDGGTAAH